jgi:putative FmdB family regulatory protein
MPFYDFECKKCHLVYEDMCPFDEAGKYPSVSCPRCKSNKKDRIFSTCNLHIKFTNPKDTSKWDNFSYRAGYNMEKAQNERRAAEDASHMGQSPYGHIDDLNQGDHFGEVK